MFKKFKFALISETVRERAKRSKPCRVTAEKISKPCRVTACKIINF